ncbi:hypothetical protein [Knoellia sp. LjRoot47]|uniref:phage tail tube protein n=1 Tax=Knoellia sp. LjRoot47 TaxID=3342330 RepID=UPI003ECF90BB
MAFSIDVPPGFDAGGMFQAWFIPGATSVASVSVADLLEADTVQVGCYFTTPPEPTAATETIEDDRACLRDPGQSRGSTTWTINDLEYIYDVQNPASVSNKAYAAMTEGSEGVLVMRYGIESGNAPVATTQFVDAYAIELGPQRKLPLTRNTKGRVSQAVFVKPGGRAKDLALTA